MGHFGRVCRGRRLPPPPPTHPQNPPTVTPLGTRAISATPLMASTKLRPPLTFEPAPTISIHMLSLNGKATVEALPDSGADICVAGTALLQQLHEHPDNLLPSTITPRAVNGTTMNPIGKLPVMLLLGTHTHTDDFHIYPNVTGTLLSWKAAKGLTILPEHYPNPPPTITPPRLAVATANEPVPTLNVKREFPSVFDGQINTMDGEEFHITLTEDAQPFCVNTPRAIPFAFRDKLKAELDFLQDQGIITPVTEPTEWCAPIVVTPKKGTDKIRMCVDLSRLNRFVERERYQSATPAQAVADIAAESAKIFTKLDAIKGYHQCPLDEDSQLLTTFITPFGRFRYLPPRPLRHLLHFRALQPQDGRSLCWTHGLPPRRRRRCRL